MTGSGKTEVYLRAAAAALEQGRGAIVLVPEIALTPQIVGRFIERFGETVAVLHSRLTPGRALRRVAAAARGRGAGLRRARARPCSRRSSDLGLIVVDEEHDASYKHEGDPRYDARDVAAERAGARGALLLLGSATPRPGERRSACPRRVLAERVDGRPLPRVRGARHARRAAGPAPATPRRRWPTCARARGKAIVLLNRRGWSNFLSCRSCGRVWSCPDCDVALVLHRAERLPRLPPLRPPRARARAAARDCSSTSVARHGAGTERLAHELAQRLRRRRLPRLPPRRRRGRRGPSGDGGGVGAILRQLRGGRRAAC